MVPSGVTLGRRPDLLSLCFRKMGVRCIFLVRALEEIKWCDLYQMNIALHKVDVRENGFSPERVLHVCLSSKYLTSWAYFPERFMYINLLLWFSEIREEVLIIIFLSCKRKTEVPKG